MHPVQKIPTTSVRYASVAATVGTLLAAAYGVPAYGQAPLAPLHLDGLGGEDMQRIDQALTIMAGINKSLGASDVLNLPIIQLQQKIQTQVQAQLAKAAEDKKPIAPAAP